MTANPNQLPTIDYLLIGHFTADLTPEGRVIGGTVSYAARTAHAFGLRVGVLTSAHPDDPLLAQLRQWAYVIVLPAAETTTFENLYTPQGRVQYIRGAAAPITAADVPDAWRTAPLVHLAPIADEIDADVVTCFHDVPILVTLQGWLRQWDETGRVYFKRWANKAVIQTLDFIVFSEEDIAQAPELESLIAADARCLIVTRADRGGTIYRPGSVATYAAVPVEVINPTGAGDVFAASFFACWHLFDHNLHRAITAAACLAAYSVTRFGLHGAPTPEEIHAVLAADES